jgi:wyosine [tRNA(Phe)-imidazoG37] synthetase (radical SAM superfamily)
VRTAIVSAPGKRATAREPAMQRHADDAHTHLATTTVYGPTTSRRYGLSLGLNVSPLASKRCPFRCAYCQLGAEKSGPEVVFPSIADLTTDLARALDRPDPPAFDHLVFSGNGEATLHPQFAAMVEVVLGFRDRHAPHVPVVLLTCGTELARPDVHAAVLRLDEVAVKLDAGTQRTLDRLDVPREVLEPARIASWIATVPSAVVQTMLVQGRVDNTLDGEIEAWLALLQQARPRRVDLYTLDRPSLDRRLAAAPVERMEAIAARVRAEVGVMCRVFPAQVEPA